nr:hypothetical protein [Tanacetum cinerariifolium]
MYPFWNTINKIGNTDAYNFKLDKKKCRVDTEGKQVKRPAKKATTASITSVVIKDTPGKFVSKKKAPAMEVPNEPTGKTKDTREEAGVKPGVPNVSKEDSSDSDDDSRGDS